MVPRINGINLIKSTITDVPSNDVFISMKYLDESLNPFDENCFRMTIFELFYNGYKPHEVHMVLSSKKIQCFT